MNKTIKTLTALFRPGILLFIFNLLFAFQVFAEQDAIAEKTPDHAAETITYFTLEELTHQLKKATLKQKINLITQIAEIKHDERPKLILNSLLQAKLYYGKAEPQQIFSIETTTQGFQATDVLTGENSGFLAKKSLKKIGINNRLRKLIRIKIAQMDLSSQHAETRKTAVKTIAKDLTPETTALLQTHLQQETDTNVITEIKIALASGNLNSQDQQKRLQAISTLSESLELQHSIALKNLLQQDSAGNYLEQDELIVDAAKQAVVKIESKISFYENIQTLFFGLSLGSVLVLAAIGLAITFGVMGVINMAHGELIMLGAYTTYVIQTLIPTHIDISLFIAIPAAFIVSGLFGILIERGVIKFLYGRPLETLLATFGISLILQQLVRSVFSPLNRSVATPSWMSGSVEYNSVLTLTLNRLYIIGFTLLVFLILLAILKKTRLGLEVRAVSQNRAMAKAMGIKTEWVDAMTFGLGSGIAGVAGVALSQLTNVGPNLGQAYIIDSFMVVVFGGVGNLWGTLISGMTLGVANKIIEPFAGAVLAKILVLIFIILFIQKRPRGLFPQKGRAAED